MGSDEKSPHIGRRHVPPSTLVIDVLAAMLFTLLNEGGGFPEVILFVAIPGTRRQQVEQDGDVRHKGS